MKFRDPGQIDELVICLTDVNSKDRVLCEAKYNSTNPILGFNNDSDLLVSCLTELSYEINRDYCDGFYTDIDNKYDCYSRINLDIPKGRTYCELKHPTSSQDKYECLINLAQEQES